MIDSRQFERFGSAIGAVIDYLHRQGDFPVWMVSRVIDGRWIVVQVCGDDIGIKPGATFQADSEGLEMAVDRDDLIVAHGPGDVPGYIDTMFASTMKVVSYAGVPIRQQDGRVFGVLSGFGSGRIERNVEPLGPLLKLLGTLLSGLVAHEYEMLDAERLAERFRFESMTDTLTHLPGRRAFEQKIERENLRCRQFGEHAFVSVVDISELGRINETRGRAAGDEMLRKAGLAIRYAVRDGDFVARLDGDEFVILGINCGPAEEHEVSQRIRAVLARSGIHARVATAIGGAGEPLTETWNSARVQMRYALSVERMEYRGPSR